MSTQKTHPDQKYIVALLENDSRLIAELYQKFAPKVIGYVCQNSGNETEARDIIQETLITLHDQAKTKNLQLTCPFDAYFFLICKRKWLNVLKKRGHKRVTIQEERLSISDDADQLAEENRVFEKQQALYKQMFSKMGDSCKKIINFGFSSMSMKQVADKLDISYAYARKKKSVCLAKLTELIKSSPKFKSLKNL